MNKSFAAVTSLGIFIGKTLCHASIVTVRCFLGPIYCSFPVGCTTYALKQLREKPLAHALKNIFWRLLACTFPCLRLTACPAVSALALCGGGAGAPNYNNSPAILLNSLRSLILKNTEPKIGCPLNLSLVVIKPLLLKSKYGESI